MILCVEGLQLKFLLFEKLCSWLLPVGVGYVKTGYCSSTVPACEGNVILHIEVTGILF